MVLNFLVFFWLQLNFPRIVSEELELNYSESWISSYQLDSLLLITLSKVQTPKEHHIQRGYKMYNQTIHDIYEWLDLQALQDWIRKINFSVRLSEKLLRRRHTFLFTQYNSPFYPPELCSREIGLPVFCICSSRIRIVKLEWGMTNIFRVKNQCLLCSLLIRISLMKDN
jgi:hypothetical protein